MGEGKSNTIFGTSLNIGILKGLNFEWNYTKLKFKPGTVDKNESNVVPLAGVWYNSIRN